VALQCTFWTMVPIDVLAPTLQAYNLWTQQPSQSFQSVNHVLSVFFLEPHTDSHFFNIQSHHPYIDLKGPILYRCSSNIFCKELHSKYVSLVSQAVSISTTPLCSHSMEADMGSM
jgi:hypothetical protein